MAASLRHDNCANEFKMKYMYNSIHIYTGSTVSSPHDDNDGAIGDDSAAKGKRKASPGTTTVIIAVSVAAAAVCVVCLVVTMCIVTHCRRYAALYVCNSVGKGTIIICPLPRRQLLPVKLFHFVH